MSVREIAERAALAMEVDDGPDVIERAIREAAKPLVEALEQVAARRDACQIVARHALAAWKEGQ